MGGVPHSGRIHVRLASGVSREFILLGDVDVDGVRDQIVFALGTPITSVV
jgi:hypothetical protein